MCWPILINVLNSQCLGHSMYSTIDVIKVDFLVIDVLEVNVLGARRRNHLELFLLCKSKHKKIIYGH
jgi:hypothetical protein